MRGLACIALLAVSELVRAGAPCWQMDSANSRLAFAAVQAGAEFTGIFREFSADICFAPDQLADSYFHVAVNPASVATLNSDRDAALLSPDFFFVAEYPQAEFETQSFQATDASHFTATGELSLRGVTQQEQLTFYFTVAADGVALLQGETTLHRLDYGVGQGDWQDTKWVGNDVRVAFHLTLLPAD